MPQRLTLILSTLFLAVSALAFSAPAHAAVSVGATVSSLANGDGSADTSFQGRWQSKYQFDYQGSVTDVCGPGGANISYGTQGFARVVVYVKSGSLGGGGTATEPAATNSYRSGDVGGTCTSRAFSRGGVTQGREITFVEVIVCDLVTSTNIARDCDSKIFFSPF